MPRPVRRDPALLLLVLLGGAAGSLLRYAVGLALPATRLPVATLTVDLTGALALGLLLGVLGRGPDAGRRRALRLGLGSGLLGAFTTYSALATETVLLARDGSPGLAAAYAGGSAVLGVLAAALGLALAGERR